MCCTGDVGYIGGVEIDTDVLVDTHKESTMEEVDGRVAGWDGTKSGKFPYYIDTR